MTQPDDSNRPLSAAEALRRGRAGTTPQAPASPATAAEPVAVAEPGATAPAYDDTTGYADEPYAETDDDTAAAEPVAGPAAWPLALLGALAIALAVTLVLTSLAVARHKATERARLDAAKAAQVAAVDVLSADYRSLDKNITKAESQLTPSFRKDYLQLAQKAFGQLAKDNHLLLTSTVTGYGVRDASPDRVIVLVFVDQVSTTLKQPTPKLAQNRVRLTMRKIDGKWLVDKIDAP